MMTFSSVVAPANVRSTFQQSPRNGVKIDHFILHHSAAFDVNQVVDEMVSGSRQVSANYVVANDGTAYGIVPEEFRAWTSGSSTDGGAGAAWDTRSITFEVLDQTGAPDWLISPAASDTVARIIADVSARYGIHPQRSAPNQAWTVYGHRELYTIFGASYATACPGGMNLDAITAAAAGIVTAGGNVTPLTNTMEDIMLIVDGGLTATRKAIALVGGPGGVHIFSGDEWNLFKMQHNIPALLGLQTVQPVNDAAWDMLMAIFAPAPVPATPATVATSAPSTADIVAAIQPLLATVGTSLDSVNANVLAIPRYNITKE